MKRRDWLLVMALASTGGCQAAPGDGEALGQLGAALTTPPSPASSVDLVAVGALGGNLHDRSTATADLLDNGVAGNLLGGIGSGLAYAGWDLFIAIPDRGPNAVSYNSAVDDTSSYINRFQTIFMSLERSARGAALPLTLTPVLLDTTLLSSRQPLQYGTGAGLDLGSGEPALNAKRRTHYFTGRSDNYDPTTTSGDPHDARLDPESVRVANDGLSVYVSDEYGPYVYEFDRFTGQRLRTFSLPAEFAVAHESPVGNDEIAGNTSGRVSNKGMEGLALSPDGRTLFGAMQSPLIQDGGTNGRFTRIIAIDVRSGATRQYAYELTNIGSASKPKYPTISELLAVNDHEFLVDERDGKGLGDDSTAAFKRVFHIDLTGAATVAGLGGEASLIGKAVTKTLFLDIVATLNAHGIASNDIPAKLEGMAFGADVLVGGALEHTLYIANDNDFIGTVTDSNHPGGIDNPNQFFVFAFDGAALPGFVHQHLAALF